MNCVYLGYRLKGLQDATNTIFNKEPAELDFDEAAEIAAMLVYPRPSFTPSSWLLKLERRKNYAKVLYPRYEKRLKKLPRRKVM